MWIRYIIYITVHFRVLEYRHMDQKGWQYSNFKERKHPIYTDYQTLDVETTLTLSLWSSMVLIKQSMIPFRSLLGSTVITHVCNPPTHPLLYPTVVNQRNLTQMLSLSINSYSASHDNWCTATLWNRIMTAQCEGMGEVGSARYEPALLPPCPSIRALCYSNCQRSTQSHQQSKG